MNLSRKIVQISTTHQSNSDSEYFSIVALCDDGTLWISMSGETSTVPIKPYGWRLIANVPQEIELDDSFFKQLGY